MCPVDKIQSINRVECQGTSWRLIPSQKERLMHLWFGLDNDSTIGNCDPPVIIIHPTVRSYPSATTCTIFLFLFFTLFSIFTTPAARAKIVWSFPMPTLSPAKNFFPRCRTMILPALAILPGHTLMPKRRPAESRPLLDDPPAFLVAFLTVISVAEVWGPSIRCWCWENIGGRQETRGRAVADENNLTAFETAAEFLRVARPNILLLGWKGSLLFDYLRRSSSNTMLGIGCVMVCEVLWCGRLIIFWCGVACWSMFFLRKIYASICGMVPFCTDTPYTYTNQHSTSAIRTRRCGQYQQKHSQKQE